MISKPIPHTADLPPLLLPILGNFDEDMSSISSNRFVFLKQKKYVEEDVTPHLICQGELDDLIRDLNLSKQKSEILGSRLQQWNLLQKTTRIFVYRNRHSDFKEYCSCLCEWDSRARG